MTLYAPKWSSIKAIQLKNDRMSRRNVTIFCPSIGFFDPAISDGSYGIPRETEHGEIMMYANDEDWLIKDRDGLYSIMNDEKFREEYYRLAYSDPPGEV